MLKGPFVDTLNGKGMGESEVGDPVSDRDFAYIAAHKCHTTFVWHACL